MQNFRAEIVWTPISQLIPYANNAKVHTDEQVDKIAGQIAAFGFDQPIVVGKDMVIIKGHGRFMAAKKLNMQEVPIIVQTLDEYQAMAARIADNEVAKTPWEEAKLKFDLGTLKRQNFDLKLTALPPLQLKTLSDSMELRPEISPGLDTGLPPGEGEGSGPDDEIEKNYGITYSLVFNTKEEQEVWFKFLMTLKKMHPDLDTQAERLVAHIEHFYAENEDCSGHVDA